MLELRESWSWMDIKFSGLEWEQSEGVVIGLLNQGLSQKEIKALLLVGGYRISTPFTAISHIKKLVCIRIYYA